MKTFAEFVNEAISPGGMPYQQQAANPQVDYRQQFTTLMNDLKSLKSVNVKLANDADAIVQGTKTQNTPVNAVLRRVSRDIREACAKIDEIIVQTSNEIAQGMNTGKYQ